MESLNFQNGQVVGKQELINWNTQLRESMAAIISKLGNGNFQGRGTMMKNTDPLGGDLLVEQGTSQVGGYNTIKINAGWGVGLIEDATADPVIASYVDSSLNGLPKDLKFLSNYAPFYTPLQDNISIPGIAGLGLWDTRYVCVYPKFTVFEDGTCNISTSNQVTFSDSSIVAKLRDQTSNSPTKLRFFTDSSTVYNGGQVYEVVSIVDGSNIIISGDFSSPETDLYVAIIGSYDLPNQALLSGSNNYNYGYIRGIVGFETSINDSVDYGGFPVAKLTFATDQSFTIEDIRGNYLFNLGAVDALLAKNNLNDLDDFDEARTNLSVYKTEETYSMTQINSRYAVKSKVVEIGVWDMDTDATRVVSVGLNGYTQFRGAMAVIRPDNVLVYHSLDQPATDGTIGGGVSVVATDGSSVTLRRTDAGFFDNSGYSSTVNSRGYLTVFYVD